MAKFNLKSAYKDDNAVIEIEALDGTHEVAHFQYDNFTVFHVATANYGSVASGKVNSAADVPAEAAAIVNKNIRRDRALDAWSNGGEVHEQ